MVPELARVGKGGEGVGRKWPRVAVSTLGVWIENEGKWEIVTRTCLSKPTPISRFVALKTDWAIVESSGLSGNPLKEDWDRKDKTDCCESP
jgi:hypothetical protein